MSASTNEPTVKCPQCGSEIKLTESLAAPLLEATRREYEKVIAQKDREVAQRERALGDQIDSVHVGSGRNAGLHRLA